MQASWWSEFKGEIKTLRLREDPRRKGLGHYRDVDGKLWDVHAIVGEHVNAREIVGAGQNGYYSTGTDSFGNGQGTNSFNLIHAWKPFKVEVISE